MFKLLFTRIVLNLGGDVNYNIINEKYLYS